MSPVRLNGSTSGYSELSAPAVAGNNTITLPTGNGTAGQVLTTNGSGALSWTGMGPAFSAYASSGQTISTSTNTKIALQTEEYDTANCFDNATNYRFTPNVAGYYQVNGIVAFSVSATGFRFIEIWKNGSKHKSGNQLPGGSVNYTAIIVSALIYFNGSTDYIELYSIQNSGSSLTTSSGAADSYFQAFLARPA